MKTWAIASCELFDDPIPVEFFSVGRVDALLVAVRHDDDDAHVARAVTETSRKFRNGFVEIREVQISKGMYLHEHIY